MKKQTIQQVVQSVIRDRGGSASINEIVSVIIKEDRYEFKVKNPRSIITRSIRRRCKGYAGKDCVTPSIFCKTSSNTYALV